MEGSGGGGPSPHTGNPFSTLLPAVDSPKGGLVSESSEDVTKTKKLLEDVFLITLDKDRNVTDHDCVFLPDLQSSLGQEQLNLQCLEQAVFERVLMPDPSQLLLTLGEMPSADAIESRPMRYLCQCYLRLQRKIEHTTIVYKRCMAALVAEGKLCLIQPDVFPDPNSPQHFMDLLLENMHTSEGQDMMAYLALICDDIAANPDEANLRETLEPMLKLIWGWVKGSVLGDTRVSQAVYACMAFTKSPHTAKVFLDYNTPRNVTNGRDYQEATILGQILSLSCLPRSTAGPYEFFKNPKRLAKIDYEAMLHTIHMPTQLLSESLHQLFHSFLKVNEDIKSLLLDWIGNCLHANRARSQIWHVQQDNPANSLVASDAFFINLGAVTLRLAQPFSQPQSPKLLKVYPSFCPATGGSKEDRKRKKVHLKGLDQATGLVPQPDGSTSTDALESEYNFLSECFFMTHWVMALGFTVGHGFIVKDQQNLSRLQDTLSQIRDGEGLVPPALIERLEKQEETMLQSLLGRKAALTEPKMLDQGFNFMVASATYLIQMAVGGPKIGKFSEISFPLPEETPSWFHSLPEMIAENIVDFVIFLRKFTDHMFELQAEGLSHLLTFVIVFMGAPQFMRNPHLRAKLAEALEAFLPPQNTSGGLVNSGIVRQRLFETHPHIQQVAVSLLHVFVSIEMTGQGVQFEQKFSYRHYMYKVLRYIWSQPVHRQVIKGLSDEALVHIEDVNPPLFLRFINLLVNDATFLLDEAISYLIQIRSKEDEEARGEWQQLGPQQAAETRQGLSHMRMIARYHNIMGLETITTLEMLTTHIQDFFLHPVLADRVAAMLNYFLARLVGRKQREIKVKDFDQVEFKPQELVSSICQIYLNLGTSADFCRAVSKDERSYSPELFAKAQDVLWKIHRPYDMIERFKELAAKIKEMASLQQEEEELFEHAPDEFLDPMMGTLMTDPVMLPSSRVVLDRTTIARHILSDQFDPYNRSPLTLDMIIPQDDLKQKIVQWKKEQRDAHKASQK